MLVPLALAALPLAPSPIQGPLVDINQAAAALPADANPSDFATLNGSTYFAADVPGLGRELCVFDGTDVSLVFDGIPGAVGLEPRNLTAAAGRLWFSAKVGSSGHELWVSDGTEAGTQFVKDLFPTGAQSGDPSDFVEFGSEVLFIGRTPTAGWGVWRSDGTEAGTTVLVSIDDGALPSLADVPEQLTVVGSQAYFSTYFGNQLWVTDGTPSGTQLVAPEFVYSGIDDLVAIGGDLYFLARSVTFNRRLWRTNGGAPELVASPTLPESMTLFGGALYITARDQNNDWAIFEADLTPGNLTHVATPLPGTGAYFRELVAAQTYLAFVVDEAAQGQELWRTDGTTAGTGLIQEAVPGAGGLDPEGLTAIGDRIVFSGTVVPGAEPWVTDGQTVSLLAELALLSGSDPAEFHFDGTSLWFAATADGVGREVFRSDGTSPGTSLAGDLAETPLSQGSDPRDFVRLGARVFFTADDGVHGREAWVSDGTSAGTRLLADIHPGPASSEIESIVVLGDQVFFVASEDAAFSLPRIEVWRSDGTPEGTERFSQLHDNGLYYPRNLAVAGGLLFFEANDFDVLGWEPYVSDGVGGIRLLGNLNPNSIAKDSEPFGYTAIDGAVYFSARDAALQQRLHRTDGTPEGTSIVDDGNPDFVQSATGLQPIGNGRALMVGFGSGQGSGSPGLIGSEPWVTDGTPSGTFPLADIAPGAQGSSVGGFFPLAGGWVFTAENADLGREFWITDGTVAGTQLLHETVVGPADDDPTILGQVNGRLLYRARDGVTRDLWVTDGVTFERLLDVPNVFFAQGVGSGLAANDELFYVDVQPALGVQEVWSTDGTAGGTQRVDAVVDSFGLGFASPVGQGPEIVSASPGADAGTEVWTTRGDAATVQFLADVNPGAASSLPRDFVRVGEALLFSAETHESGRELYSLPFVDTQGHVLEPFGQGCVGALGIAPRLEAVGAARLGETVELQLTDAFPASSAFLFLSFGASPAPLDDCKQYLAEPLFPFGVLPTGVEGAFSLPIALPAALTGLVGDAVYFQAGVLDPAGGFGGAVSLTNALEAIVGPAF